MTDQIMRVEEAALASERERADKADAMALEAIAQRDHAEAALAALKAEALEVVGYLADKWASDDWMLDQDEMAARVRAFADKYRGEG